MIRAKLADVIRPDDGRCYDCGGRRGAMWVRKWAMSSCRPWTYLLPRIERLCYGCWVDREVSA